MNSLRLRPKGGTLLSVDFIRLIRRWRSSFDVLAYVASHHKIANKLTVTCNIDDGMRLLLFNVR